MPHPFAALSRAYPRPVGASYHTPWKRRPFIFVVRAALMATRAARATRDLCAESSREALHAHR
jgi:hypothetical protein